MLGLTRPVRVMYRLCIRFFYLISFLLVYPTVIGYSYLVGKKYYFAKISMVNIGGFSTTVDAFLRRTVNKPENIEYVFIRQNNRVANEYFYSLAKKKLLIPESSALKLLLSPLVNVNNPLNVTKTLSYLKGCELKERQRLVWFEESDHIRGKELLTTLGIVGDDAWYVCFNARDNAYARSHQSSREVRNLEPYHSHRNSDIDTYIKAIKFILDRGGYVVRIGSIVEKSIGYMHPRLIDYPFSSHKSDFADIYLACHCKFIIGNASGVVDLSWIVDMPFGRVNEPIYSHKWVRPNTIFIPKLIKWGTSNKFLTIKKYYELFDENRAHDFYGTMKQMGLIHVDNSDDDILQVTESMYHLYVLQEKSHAEVPCIISQEAHHCGDIWHPFLARHPELIGEAVPNEACII